MMHAAEQTTIITNVRLRDPLLGLMRCTVTGLEKATNLGFRALRAGIDLFDPHRASVSSAAANRIDAGPAGDGAATADSFSRT
jgi:hypothetical protein